MSAQFTPGPWTSRYLADDLDFDFEVNRPEDGLPVAAVYQWSGGESEANARLIALTPEFYEYVASSASNGCATAQALIARAEKQA